MNKTDPPLHNDLNQTIQIGVVGRPHGNRGAFRFFPHNTSSNLLDYLDQVIVKLSDSSVRTLKIVDIKPGSKNMIMELAGITSRRMADDIKGAIILVPRSQLPNIDEDEFYIEDLIGINVWRDDELLGKIISSREQGGIEVVTVSDDDSDLEIPLVNQYVVSLNIKLNNLTVKDVDDLPRSNSRKKRH